MLAAQMMERDNTKAQLPALEMIVACTKDKRYRRRMLNRPIGPAGVAAETSDLLGVFHCHQHIIEAANDSFRRLRMLAMTSALTSKCRTLLRVAA